MKALAVSEARQLTKKARDQQYRKALEKVDQQQKTDLRNVKALLQQVFAEIRQAANEGKISTYVSIRNAPLSPASPEEFKAPQWVHQVRVDMEEFGYNVLVLRNHQQACFSLSVSWAE